MKKIIFSALATTGLFASPDAYSLSHPPRNIDFETMPETYSEENFLLKQGFFYVRFSTAEGDLSQFITPHPGLGLGYRRLAGDGAVDISVSGLGHHEDKGNEFFWSAPKVTFIHYFSPQNEKSVYLGGAVAWGGIKRDHQKFIGIIPSAILGYEFLRKSSVLGFLEATVSQPAIAVQKNGKVPSLIGELSLGAGF